MSDITRYEIVARRLDGIGHEHLVGYTPRVSRQGLLDAMKKVGDALIRRLPIGEADLITFATKPRPHCHVAGWWIGFTGRTRNQCQLDGEIRWIGYGAPAEPVKDAYQPEA